MNYDTKIERLDEEHDAPAFNPLVENDEESRRSRRQMWIFAIVAGVVLVGLWMAMHLGNAPAPDTARNQAPVVTVIQPGRTTISGTITATGTLAARRPMPVGSAGDGGQVVSVLVEPGAWVRAGQVLAVVDRSVQTQQQASLAAQIQVASADARLAQANLDRALKLVARGFVSKADIDRLTATRDAAAARVGVARAQLGEMQARTRRLNIVAPAAGLVLERKVDPGQIVTTGSGMLFSLARDGEMELLARLTEEDLAAMRPGLPATVTPVGAVRGFTGSVWQVSPVIDPQTRQGTVRIALPYSPELRPGGFANVALAAGAVEAPLLPESAVLSDDRGSYVYLVDEANKVVRRDVKTGTLTAGGVAIVAGLSGRERVVQRAGAFLSVGETVKPRLAAASRR